MTTRVSRGVPAAAGLALALVSSTALAQDEAAPAGPISAGTQLMTAKGIDADAGISLGSWVELLSWARYRFDDRLSAGASMPLLVASPVVADVEFDALQAFVVDGRAELGLRAHAVALVGVGVRGRLGQNPWGGGLAQPGRAGDLELGFGAGGGYARDVGKLRLSVEGLILVQLVSATDGNGEDKPLVVLHLPCSAMYAIDAKLAVGVASGIYTGSDLSFDSEDGYTLPFVARGSYALSRRIELGGFLGLGSIAPPDGLDVGDTLAIGVHASWRQ